MNPSLWDYLLFFMILLGAYYLDKLNRKLEKFENE